MLNDISKNINLNLNLNLKRKKQIGAPPGTLIFTGEQKTDETRIIRTVYNAEEINTAEIKVDNLPDAIPGKVTWYDVHGLHNVDLIEKIGRKFKIHPLILEDILDVHQRPKFEEYKDSFVLIVKMLRFNAEKREVEIEQISVYVRENLVISFQENTDSSFAAVADRLATGRGKVRQRAADYLAYALLDVTVDNYYTILDKVEDVTEKLEEKILENPDSKIKSEIHSLKLQMLVLRKSVSPLREAVNRFSDSDSTIIQESSQVFIRDLYDHTIQVMDMIETYRDILNGLYDLYLSEISFKMNSVMQVLTIISTIFIPLTFLAGIYGMNFEYIPELQYRYAYPIFWAVMITIALILVYFFKRKNWI